MSDSSPGGLADALLGDERAFVLSLGGFTIGFAGGTLLVHDRIPVPRFNFATVERVGANRQTGFFERALDQYFQRAIRPTFRVARPVPLHIDRTLRQLGFRAQEESLDLLAGRRLAAKPAGYGTGRLAGDEDARELAQLWVGEREAPEFATALDILRHHPNPGEALVPVVVDENGERLGAALVYRHDGRALFFGVSTQPSARGRGVATGLVRYAMRSRIGGHRATYGLLSDSARLTRRLTSLGLRRLRSMTVYELCPDAELSLPPVPGAGPPHWRPPRACGSDNNQPIRALS